MRKEKKKTATAAGQVAAAAAAKEPELLAVKLEPADEDLIEEVKELSSLRMCNLCNTRNYLRQGLCCNMYCQAFYMLDPHAGEKLTSRGKYEHGAKWSPYEWQKHAQPRIECNQLAQAFQDGIAEYAHELEEAMLPHPQVEGAAKFIVDPVIIEDLESGEKHEHPPSVPPLETMPDEYKQAIKESSKRKQSKGVKRVLSLHAAIQKKKQKGLWVGPDIPMAGLTNDQQTWMNERVKKAIETAPWHRNWLSLDWQHIFHRKRCLLLLLFEIQDLLRGGLVAKISIGNNLLRGDDLFLNIIGNKLPMFSQQRFASPHSQKHLLPTLVALRPDPAAESCVDPQTVDNCVEWSIVSYLVPSFFSFEIGHHGVSLALTWHVVWSSKKVALLRGVTANPIASKCIFKIQIYQFQIYVNDMNRVSIPQRRNIIYWILPPNMQHRSHVSSCQLRFRGSTMAWIPMARDPNQKCHGGSVGSEWFQD